MTYREAHITCYRGEFPSPPQSEITGDEVRDHLTRSVLPRLATEGWVLETGDTGWNPVKPRVPWWGQSAQARQEVYDALLEAARRAVQRSKALTPQAGPASVLEGLDLSKSFKGRRVVDHVTVRVQQGEIVGLLGPNGAGKTTTFYLITGLIRPDDGRVLLDGQDLTRAPMYRAGADRDRLPGPGAVDLPKDDRRGEYSGNPGDPQPGPGGALQPARADAGRAVHQAPAAEQGLLAHRRRAAAAGDHPGAGDRAQVHAARRAVRRRGSDRRPRHPDHRRGSPAPRHRRPHHRPQRRADARHRRSGLHHVRRQGPGLRHACAIWSTTTGSRSSISDRPSRPGSGRAWRPSHEDRALAAHQPAAGAADQSAPVPGDGHAVHAHDGPAAASEAGAAVQSLPGAARAGGGDARAEGRRSRRRSRRRRKRRSTGRRSSSTASRSAGPASSTSSRSTSSRSRSRPGTSSTTSASSSRC